jgi:hypothetical protein
MPTFVAEYGDTWNTTTSPKTASVTVANGDGIVVIGMTSDQGATLGTPTGGGLTYTLQQSVVVAAYCTVYVWTALSSSSQTFDVSITRSGDDTLLWGLSVLRFSSVSAVGASSKTNVSSGAPSLGLTTTGANSVVVTANADWNATDGTSRTWRTVNVSASETTYFRDAAAYTVYVAYYTDSGSAGAKTTGLSAPSGQKYAIVSVEIQGGAGGTTCSPTAISSGEAFGTASVSTTITCSPTAISSAEALGSPTITATITCSPGGVATAEVFGTPTVSSIVTCSPGGVGSAETFGTAVVSMTGSSSPVGISSEEAFGTPTVTATITVLPFSITSNETFGTPTAQYVAVRKRLKDLYISTPYPLAGDAQSYVLREGLTAYGNAAPLAVKRDPSNRDLEGKTYVFRGGYVHESDDPAVIQMWLDSGFEVEDV